MGFLREKKIPCKNSNTLIFMKFLTSFHLNLYIFYLLTDFLLKKVLNHMYQEITNFIIKIGQTVEPFS